MKGITRRERDYLVQQEASQLALLFSKYISTAEECEKGIAAMEKYWRNHRRDPIARWIRFYVLGWQAELLQRAGRLEEALSASTRSLSLPANPYARRIATWNNVRLLRRNGRLEEALESAISGLNQCSWAQDFHIACGLIREIVRMDMPAWLEILADQFPDVVLEAAKLPGVAEFITTEEQTPVGILKMLAVGMRTQTASPQESA